MLVCMVISLVPPGDSTNKFVFEVKVVAMTVVAILLGLVLYWRGARAKRMELARRIAERRRPRVLRKCGISMELKVFRICTYGSV